jgi:hypothetical protein
MCPFTICAKTSPPSESSPASATATATTPQRHSHVTFQPHSYKATSPQLCHVGFWLRFPVLVWLGLGLGLGKVHNYQAVAKVFRLIMFWQWAKYWYSRKIITEMEFKPKSLFTGPLLPWRECEWLYEPREWLLKSKFLGLCALTRLLVPSVNPVT